jgi:hypothetical protein
MSSLQETLRVLNEMKTDGVLSDYAVAGAMALLFWVEPIPTYDLDVLVFLPPADGPIVSLDSIYRWTEQRHYPVDKEHVLIAGIPVQFLPAHNELADEAINTAEPLQYQNVAVRVVRPEYLIALYLEPGARTAKRMERAAALRDSPTIDSIRLQDILKRFNLTF